ncbi:MAG TPA: hypothetical protein VGK66_01505 [Solirubrobacterales bacterium]|nr:hypothetical protein [Solirubrobacterales bacterium]
MQAGMSTVLAVCGGGNNTLAIVFLLVVAAVYALTVIAGVRRAEDATEMLVLIALFLVSAVVSGLIFFFPGGNPSVARFVISIVVTGGMALVIAAKWREEIAGRAVFVAFAGDLLVPGGFVALLIAAFGIGEACLD